TPWISTLSLHDALPIYEEARAAEAGVLDRAARLTPGGLRAAVARAVMAAAPETARERRESAARDARVERWLQDSGNAALMGCERSEEHTSELQSPDHLV